MPSTLNTIFHFTWNSGEEVTFLCIHLTFYVTLLTFNFLHYLMSHFTLMFNFLHYLMLHSTLTLYFLHYLMSHSTLTFYLLHYRMLHSTLHLNAAPPNAKFLTDQKTGHGHCLSLPTWCQQSPDYSSQMCLSSDTSPKKYKIITFLLLEITSLTYWMLTSLLL